MIHSESGDAVPEPASDSTPGSSTAPPDAVVIDLQPRLARASGMELPVVDERAFFSVAERVFPSFPRSGRYSGVELLDTGATSSVWRAFDAQLQLDVAIKVFDRSNRTLHEVLDEARAACAVRHDYVVRVIDVVGEDPPFIVMELVAEDGQIGSSAFVERPRSLHEAVRWVREVAAGVHAAHQRFVLHRDLKPRNVLITPVSRRAMVADFGLGISRKRRDRCIVGTSTHMAPEQALGVPPALDMRGSAEDRQQLVAIDVFGLGALAFDLLTGNPPYSPDSQRGALERAQRCDREALIREVIRAPHGLEALAQVMRYILEVNEHVGPGALEDLLERDLGPEAKDAIMTAGQQIYEQGREKGIEQGRQLGRQEGVQGMLLRLLRQRFGNAVNADVEQRIATASVEQIEAWSARVLSAATLAELFAD